MMPLHVMQIDYTILTHVLVCSVLGLSGLLASVIRSKAALLSAGLIATLLTMRERSLGYFVAVAVVYVCAVGICGLARRSAKPSVMRWRLAVIFIVLFVAGFTVLRLTGVEDVAVDISVWTVAVVTLDMWLVLRLVTFVWEVGAGRVNEPDATDFVAWAINPFTLFGPVLRFSDFIRQTNAWKRTDTAEPIATGGTLRTYALGFGQLSVGYALSYMLFVLPTIAGIPHVVVLILTFAVLAPWSWYLVIAGFFKVMEACASQWGLALPPSFDRAFAQRNLADFWARWNMTATAVFRDYVFYMRWGFPRPNVYFNTMLVFVLVGLWHSANAYWLLWGSLHGAGFCVFLAFRRYGAPLRRLAGWMSEGFRNGLSWATTYVFVCACWALPPWLIQHTAASVDSLWRLLTST